MLDLWSEELTEEETERLLDRAAHEIRRRKLEVPATIFFEMHRPLAFVGSQMAVMFSPFLVPFLGFDFMNDYSRLLSKPDNVEGLLRRLDPAPTTPDDGVVED